MNLFELMNTVHDGDKVVAKFETGEHIECEVLKSAKNPKVATLWDVENDTQLAENYHLSIIASGVYTIVESKKWRLEFKERLGDKKLYVADIKKGKTLALVTEAWNDDVQINFSEKDLERIVKKLVEMKANLEDFEEVEI